MYLSIGKFDIGLHTKWRNFKFRRLFTSRKFYIDFGFITFDYLPTR